MVVHILVRNFVFGFRKILEGRVVEIRVVGLLERVGPWLLPFLEREVCFEEGVLELLVAFLGVVLEVEFVRLALRVACRVALSLEFVQRRTFLEANHSFLVVLREGFDPWGLRLRLLYLLGPLRR